MKYLIKFKYIFFIYMSILLSCNNNNRKNSGEAIDIYNKPSIEVTANTDVIDFKLNDIKVSDFEYDIVDSIKFVELEFSENSIIGVIDAVQILNNKIYVTDYNKAKAIFVFDITGNFLYKISKFGQGPGEYQRIDKVRVKDNSITILDRLSRKLIRYDLLGNLITEKRINSFANDITQIGNHIYMAFSYYTEEIPFHIVISDSSLTSKETALPFTVAREEIGQTRLNLQETDNNAIFYGYPLCDTIFLIEGNTIRPKFKLSIYNPSEVKSFNDDRRQLSNDDYFDQILASDIPYFYNFIELDNLYYIDYQVKNIAYFTLISKSDYKNTRKFMKVDQDYKSNIPFRILNNHENAILFQIDSNFPFLDDASKELFRSLVKSKGEIKYLENLENENRNPLVCLLYFKEPSI